MAGKLKTMPTSPLSVVLQHLLAGALDRQEQNDIRMVSPSEGNEARRKGRRTSHIFIVPLTQGNLYRGDPVEGRRMLAMEAWVGHPSGALYPGCGST
jgi:hypothetical protein